MRSRRLRHGTFIAPFHPVDEDPTSAIARDLELVEFLDHHGYEEAWIGEHHSAGYEIIASPELTPQVLLEMIAGLLGLPWPTLTMMAFLTSTVRLQGSLPLKETYSISTMEMQHLLKKRNLMVLAI